MQHAARERERGASEVTCCAKGGMSVLRNKRDEYATEAREKGTREERNRSRTIYRVWLHKDVVISKNLLEEPKAGAIFGRKNLFGVERKKVGGEEGSGTKNRARAC